MRMPRSLPEVKSRQSQIWNFRAKVIFILTLATSVPALLAQVPAQNLDVSNSSHQAVIEGPLTITFQDALQRAQKNDPQYRSALTNLAIAHEDRVQTRSALLPNVAYDNSYIFTQGTGLPHDLTSRFVANNGVHEYLNQADVHQAFSLAGIAQYRRSAAALSLARAQAEIAARGLAVTVTQTYYALVVAERKFATAGRAAAESGHFLGITQKLENGGEVAHSDVVKATIQTQQKERDLQESKLAVERARLDLAVLLFPDFNQDFTVVDDLQAAEPLPTFVEAEAAGQKNNPELRVALSAVEAADHQVTAALGGLLPALSLDYFYGIDANAFSIRSGRVRNLGYSAVATLQIPVFSWGANRSKLKQAELGRDQARVELSHTQRQLLAHLRQFYEEAATARSEMESLAHSSDLAAESLRLTNLRYQAGEATVLEVVDAQNTLTQARDAFDDGQSRYRVALAMLQTVTGSF